MTHDEMIAVIRAHKDGKVVEVQDKYERLGWRGMTTTDPSEFDFSCYGYRVKPVSRVLYAGYGEVGNLIVADPNRAFCQLHDVVNIVKFVEAIDE